MNTAAFMLLIVLGANGATAADKRVQKVAVIAALSGDVAIERAELQPARIRAWLLPGDAVHLGESARMVLVFRSGRRFELRGPARFTVMAEALKPGRGVIELERLPPWPRDIQPDEVRGGRAAGTRVRSGTLEGLLPADGDVVLAEDVWLRFHADGTASAYAFEVRDARGQLVFQTRTSTSEVRVPAGHLRPGFDYVWSVQAVGSDASGEATFSTLDARAAQVRKLVWEYAERAGQPDVQQYLEALDSALGLSSVTRP